MDCAPIDWKDREPEVAYVGGVRETRGIRQMVQAMGMLPAICPARLKIASAEDPVEIIPDLTKVPGWSKVRYLGSLDRAGISGLLGSVRAGLVLFHPEPNHIESMPHKLFEYMAAGVPVIASDFPFWRRMLGPAECCVFVDPMQPRAIAGAIEFLLSRPQLSEEMGRRGQLAVKNRFNWNSQARQLIELYAGLVGTPCAA
jgi:glycosyltransferase involved in cell wall biosynthesis